MKLRTDGLTGADWLGLTHLQADPKELIYNDNGKLIEVQVTCRTSGKTAYPRLNLSSSSMRSTRWWKPALHIGRS